MNLKRIKKVALYSFIFVLIQACGGNSNGKFSSETADSTSVATPEDTLLTVARMNTEQSGRKFIRNGELKFQVKSVRKATTQVESLVAKYQGFVSYTSLTTNIHNIEKMPISADSTLETKFYGMENEMYLRMPNQKMDSLLTELNHLVHFLDYRLIKADDVGLTLLAKELQNKRLDTYRERQVYAINQKKADLSDVNYVEENLLDKQNSQDENLIEKLRLEDQINYSTIHLYLYQRETASREVIANYKNIQRYRPSLGLRILEALHTGWLVLQEIIVFLFQLWFLWLAGIAGYFGYRFCKNHFS
jgi:hypothetical protein